MAGVGRKVAQNVRPIGPGGHYKMAMIYDNKVFLEHPRTGSTSIREALKALGGEVFSRHSLVVRDMLTVSVVRNPYDCLVSWWLVKGRKNFKTFEDFLLRCRDPFMVKDGRLFYYSSYCDRILRFESLDKDFYRLMKIHLGRYMVTENKRNYRVYYGSKSRAIVKARFGEELDFYGYTF